jgi:dTDP-glucose pyrophosphorylase
VVASDTTGPVEPCLAAASGLIRSQPLLVLDSDLYFQSSGFFELLNGHEWGAEGDRLPSGALVWHPSRDPRYSYALIENGRVVRTAEKDAISGNALAGAYFFASFGLFEDAARELMARPPGHLKEYYVSELYNILIRQGRSVVAFPARQYLSFGTPQELGDVLARPDCSELLKS